MQAIAPLEQLAMSDPTVAPLARLQAVALRAADEAGWSAGLPQPPGLRSEQAAPLLHGATLRVEADRVRDLLAELAATLDQDETGQSAQLRALIVSPEVDPLALLQDAIAQDLASLQALAERHEVEPAVLIVLAHTATLPLLVACGREIAGRLASADWSHGYCPLCGAWPTLAEERGLERQLFLRCGRCGSGWPFEHRRCPFCGDLEQGAQSYLAAEQERESRRAVACNQCHGYLKTQATLGPLAFDELLLRDLETLELDLAALEHGYNRPEAPGWPLVLTLERLRKSKRWWSR